MRGLAGRLVRGAERRVRGWTSPRQSLMLGAASDLMRGKKDLMVENALLRQQVIVLHRQVSRVRLTPLERVRIVLVTRFATSWQDALLIVKP